MTEGLLLPDGKPVPVTPATADTDRAFAEAMAAPENNDAVPAPPKRVQPEPGEKPRKRRGRPPKNERPRVTPKAEEPAKDDYTEDALKFVASIWSITASLPLAQTQAVAFVVSANADPLAVALANGAKSSARLRRVITGTGEISWRVQLAAVAINLGLQVRQVLSDPELLEKAQAATKAQLAEALQAQAAKIPEENESDAPVVS